MRKFFKNAGRAMKAAWKTRMGKAWYLTGSILIFLMLAIFIATTQVPLIYGTVQLVLGEERLSKNAIRFGEYYSKNYETKEESVAANKKLSQEISEEGIVLLKNDDDTLPLKDVNKISVFGKNSVNMVYGGSGSGARDAGKVVNLYDALKEVGFDYNPHLKAFYDDDSQSGAKRDKLPGMGTILTGYPIFETPKDNYNGDLKATYEEYGEAAIVVLTRIGGEGYDLPRTMFYNGSSSTKYDDWTGARNPVPGALATTSHYLQLDKNEIDLLVQVCDNFNKVIVVLNSGTAMELGFLDGAAFWDNLNISTDYSNKIQAALWAGNPGEVGNLALARILRGEVNPSGRTVSTFPRDFKQDPTWYNFGNHLEDKGNEYFISNWGTKAVSKNAYFVRYEEGIYVGYRYWETAGMNNDAWYDKQVVYPFGYGLSYGIENLTWELIDQRYADDDPNGVSTLNPSTLQGGSFKKDGEMVFTVRVTNDNAFPVKDVVQLYYTPPYYDEEIEKSYVVLGDFEKHEVPANGHKDFVLRLKVSDMASYDWNDANDNKFKGYELDSGEYTIRFSRSAHEHVLSYDYFLLDNHQYRADPVTTKDVVNRFDNVSKYIPETGTQYMSRAGGSLVSTRPTKSPRQRVSTQFRDGLNVYPAGEDRTVNFFKAFNLQKATAEYDADKPWFVPENKMPLTGQKNGLLLKDMVELDYNDPLWEKLLDQLTISEMNQLIGIGAFSTKQVASAQKPITKEYDGPSGFVVGSFMQLGASDTEVGFYPCPSLIGATWSKELAKRFGDAIGEEALWGADFSGTNYTFTGWYAPGINIQRSQFGGRNFEYYSEDGVHSGKIAASVSKAAQARGVNTYLKHFAVNDQETCRSSNGIATWASEQSMREIYFKSFEIAVKEGGSQGIMTSFNRIGSEWAGSSYALLTEVLRNEWGFKGSVITDYNNGAGSYMDLDLMIRAGGDLNLFQSSWLSTDKKSLTATHVTAMRNASRHILYATAKSNGMNNPYGSLMMPLWEEVMLWIYAGLVVGIGVWGFFTFRGVLKKGKGPDGPEPITAKT